ncbi:NAD-dependent epimerase/dehydratase family protein [Fimbriiglobus ruber]|uniref:UDP-glucose 4-epimerase n=1 Tax=Fimbriiglobus ruber TaxID=1908690 RepID=A0A225E672_9BACT|nr:NAD(P)-dependent oxidoreductase [Fimbriiglobus ruber]OWK46308.1 UDP-glucose 4-epimerase [Fimbriiglobus ruber]
MTTPVETGSRPTGRAALVTGASGFLGANLTRRLIADGWRVHVLLRSPSPWRLAGLAGRYTPHAADLCDAVAVRSAVAAAAPDVVFHAAALGALPDHKDSAAIIEANALGTARLLEAVADSPETVVVHTGSSSEVGHSDEPITEQSPLRPRSAYAVSKAAASLMCQAEFLRGRPVCTVRVFSAYGPWDDRGRLLTYLLGCVARGEGPKVTSGSAPRDWVFVGDVIDLMLRVAADPRKAGPLVQAAGGRPQSVRDMVEAVLAVAAGGRLTAEYGTAPPRPDEPRHWSADVTETRARTGWAPRHSLAAGVEATWEWFRTQHSLEEVVRV